MNDPAQRIGRRVGVIAALVVFAALLVALGVWQVRRLEWKEALIARTDAAMHAPPISPRELTADLRDSEYRKVIVSGVYDPRGLVLVTGTSTLGPGYWVLVPLRDSAGTVYVNRGFAPMDSNEDAQRRALPLRPVVVTGLVRLTEPGGTLLHSNRPADGRWYSRDIAAIARSRGARVDTRWFIDAQRELPAVPDAPTPGLTIVEFANNHLAYALTWFALALLSAGGAIVLWRRQS